METLCKVRDLYRSITRFESDFEHEHQICLNEGMVLCSLNKSELLSSGEIADLLGLTCSNTSKVIRSVEEKGFIERILGEQDKRQMYFRLTPAGKTKLRDIDCKEIEMPELLSKVMKMY